MWDLLIIPAVIKSTGKLFRLSIKLYKVLRGFGYYLRENFNEKQVMF